MDAPCLEVFKAGLDRIFVLPCLVEGVPTPDRGIGTS